MNPISCSPTTAAAATSSPPNTSSSSAESGAQTKTANVVRYVFNATQSDVKAFESAASSIKSNTVSASLTTLMKSNLDSMLEPILKFLFECDPLLSLTDLRKVQNPAEICNLAFFTLLVKVAEHDPNGALKGFGNIASLALCNYCEKTKVFSAFLKGILLTEEKRKHYSSVYDSILCLQSLPAINAPQTDAPKSFENASSVYQFYNTVLKKYMSLLARNMEETLYSIAAEAKYFYECDEDSNYKGDACVRITELLRIFGHRAYKFIEQLRTGSVQQCTTTEVTNILGRLVTELSNYELKTSFLYMVLPQSVVAKHSLHDVYVKVHESYSQFFQRIDLLNHFDANKISTIKISKRTQQKYFDLIKHIILEETVPKFFPEPEKHSKVFFDLCGMAVNTYEKTMGVCIDKIFGENEASLEFIRKNLERTFSKITLPSPRPKNLLEMFQNFQKVFNAQSDLFVKYATDETLPLTWLKQQFSHRRKDHANNFEEIQATGRHLVADVQPMISQLNYMNFCTSIISVLVNQICSLEIHVKNKFIKSAAYSTALFSSASDISKIPPPLLSKLASMNQPQITSMSKFHERLFFLLKKYNDNFSKENAAVLPFTTWRMVVKDILVLLPAKKSPEQACEAFRTLISGSYLDQNTNALTEYCTYLKKCGLPESEQTIYKGLAETIITAQIELEAINSETIDDNEKELVILGFLGIFKDYIALFKPLCEKARKEIDIAIIRESWDPNSKLVTLLQSLKIFSHNRIPHLNFIFESTQIDWLFEVELERIFNLCFSHYFELFSAEIFYSIREEIRKIKEQKSKDDNTAYTNSLNFAIDTIQKYLLVFTSLMNIARNVYVQINTDANCTQKSKGTNSHLTSNSNLYILQTEEEMLAQEASEEALSKELSSKIEFIFTSQPSKASEMPAAASSSAVAKSALVNIPKRVPSKFNTKLSDLIFDFQNALVPQNFSRVPPANIQFNHDAAKLAKLEQIQANDGLMMALEMIFQCKTYEHLSWAMDLILEFGHRGIEQALSAESFQSNSDFDSPLKYSAHDLNLRFNFLKEKAVLESRWTLNAFNMPFFYRYPFYYEANDIQKMPLALEHSQCGSRYTVEEFCKDLPNWIYDALRSQTIVLHKRNDNSSNEIQMIVESITKTKFAEKTFVEESSAKVHSDLIVSDQKLEACIKKLQPHAMLSTACANAVTHLKRLKTAIGIVSAFPQVRYKHVILHSLISSVKYFAENLGAALGFQQGEHFCTQLLSTYGTQYSLGNKMSERAKKTLQMIDVGTGNEYSYRYFSYTPQNAVKPLLQTKSKFYALSKEAWSMGDSVNEVHAKEMEAELIDLANQFANLAVELVDTHF